MKKILVACGSGIATSTVARAALEELMADKGIGADKVSFTQTSIPQIPSMANEYDLIVTTARYTEDVGVPVVNGLPFLTNIGEDAVVDKIITLLGFDH
jgi:PTS system galactitol-specific IIB component